MMAMTRNWVAVGPREDEMANSCMKTHPLSTFVKAAAVNVVFVFISASSELKAVGLMTVRLALSG